MTGLQREGSLLKNIGWIRAYAAQVRTWTVVQVVKRATWPIVYNTEKDE